MKKRAIGILMVALAVMLFAAGCGKTETNQESFSEEEGYTDSDVSIDAGIKEENNEYFGGEEPAD